MDSGDMLNLNVQFLFLDSSIVPCLNKGSHHVVAFFFTNLSKLDDCNCRDAVEDSPGVFNGLDGGPGCHPICGQEDMLEGKPAAEEDKVVSPSPNRHP